MMHDMQTFDVIILGDGLVAKTFALALKRIGLSSARVAPHYPPYENDPRSYAIAPSSLRMLKALGLSFEPDKFVSVTRVELGFGDHFDENIYPVEHDARDMFVMIDHTVINNALDKALAEPAISAAPKIFQLEPYFYVLPEIEARAPLLVVAEGKQSESLARLGIGFERVDYHQRAITAKLATSIPHAGVARQLFEPTGPLGILPHANSEISIVWSQKESLAEALLALDDVSFTRLLTEKIGRYYGELELRAPRASFPLYHGNPTRLVAERLALIGDSAHSIHPISGQGLNLGLRDVACLVDCIRQNKMIGLDIGASDVLSKYKTWRKADIARMGQLTRAMNEFTQSDNPFVAGARAIGFSVLKSPNVRARLAQESDPPLHPQPPLLDGRLF